VKTKSEYNTRTNSRRLADLKNRTAELERKLSDARGSLERELAQSTCTHTAAPGQARIQSSCALEHGECRHDAYIGAPDPAPGYDDANSPVSNSPVTNSAGQVPTLDERTEVIVKRGRRSAYHRGLSRGHKVAIAVAVVAAVVTSVVMMMSGGASWPASVAVVQSETSRACINPDVQSEPGQVNFACAKATRQILWVFALLTSADDPNFMDAKTGRLGLEPITATQGGEVAWSLNLHHPYSPANPIDSLEVAARAINNIIGGATLTGANGTPVVQSGLEGDPANCLRYTGSAVVVARNGFPTLCAKPVTSPAGQGALVADVYQKWVVGAAPHAAQNAAVLFENAANPGDPQVQAILKQLPSSKLLG
jgi:hypothetical protein